MSNKIYLHLLFFFGILCQAISAMLSENTSSSSDSLVRSRPRVIDHSPGARDETVNYIVKIILGNRNVCSGAILSHSTVITAARCVFGQPTAFNVLSGGAHDSQWNYHNITSRVGYYGPPPIQLIDGIVLLTVHPLFVYTRRTGNIEFHTGPLPEGSLINVFGWDRIHPTGPGNELRHRLRTITLPIMNRGECINLFRENHRATVTGKHICTICAQQFCYRDEIGGPLVFNNRLVGIHTWKGEIPGQLNPDLFVNLQLPIYSQWIREHFN